MKDILRCICCDRGIYLSSSDLCSSCGAKLQLSINIHKLEESIKYPLSELHNNSIATLSIIHKRRLKDQINTTIRDIISFIKFCVEL